MIQENETRMKAIAWFKSLTDNKKAELSDKYFKENILGFNVNFLTGRMMEIIWSGEGRNKKFVVLEHLTMPDRGFRFWGTNSSNNTHSAQGKLWYKEVLFTDDVEEAINVSQRPNQEVIPTVNELHEYYSKQNKKNG